jgi:hypothetical protein
MRAALLLALISGAAIAAAEGPVPLPLEGQSGRWRMLDNSARARTMAYWSTRDVTAAEFREMQRHYRPQDFDMWTKRLRRLKPGMTEKEVVDILQPKHVGAHITIAGECWNEIFLDDAYLVKIYVEPNSGKMIKVSPPLARTYEIKSDQKKASET